MAAAAEDRDEFTEDGDDDEDDAERRRKKKRKKKHKDAIERFEEEEEKKRHARKERKKKEKELRMAKLMKAKYKGGKRPTRGSNDSDEDDLLSEPSDASIHSMLIQGADILEKSVDLWIEHSTLNIGMFRISPFEYNIFDDTGQRILFVMPAIGSTEILRGNDRPSNYTVHTYMGREICDVTYELPSCCKKEMKVKVLVADEFFGSVDQVKSDFVVTTAELKKIMKVTKVDIQNHKLFHVNCDVAYYTNLEVIIGSFGRNGKKAEHLKLGTEPLGFYFRSKNGGLTETGHKIFIVSMLIGLTLACKSLYQPKIQNMAKYDTSSFTLQRNLENTFSLYL